MIKILPDKEQAKKVNLRLYRVRYNDEDSYLKVEAGNNGLEVREGQEDTTYLLRPLWDCSTDRSIGTRDFDLPQKSVSPVTLEDITAEESMKVAKLVSETYSRVKKNEEADKEYAKLIEQGIGWESASKQINELYD